MIEEMEQLDLAPRSPRPAHDFNIWISIVLIAGVATAAIILAVGLLLFLGEGGANTSVAALLDSSPHGISDTFRLMLMGVVRREPISIMTLGVVVLLATPVVRVLASVFLFLAERD